MVIRNSDIKAAELTKLVLKHGCNQSAVAKELGVSKQAIQQRMKKKPVQDCLQRWLSSKELKSELIAVGREGLRAKKPTLNNKGQVKLKADHFARHRYWHDLMVGSGGIKDNGASASVNIHLNYGYRRDRANDNDVRD